MVNIKGKNVLLMKHYLGAWGWELQRGAAGDAVRLMRHAIQRAAADPFDEPNVREAVAVAALGMVEQLRQHRGPSDGLNLDDTAAFLGEIAEGKEMQTELQGSGGVVGQVRVSEGERSITTERVQRLAGAKWQLRLGPALSDVENLPNDYAIVGGHELMRFMEEGFARFKLGECGWREVCQEWRRAFDLLMYRTLIDPSPPGLLRRAFAASAMVLILSIPEAPDGAEDVSDLVPSPQMLEWWREAVGCVADGSTLAATLVHDDGYLHDVRFEHGELEGRSELDVLPTSVASTFARVEEPIPGLPGPKTRLRASAPIPRREKIGRNAPCPCGSGQKYKRCCGSDA